MQRPRQTTTNAGVLDGNPEELFAQLVRRGIGRDEYTEIKQIIEFNIPPALVFFYRTFGSRTIASVLSQVKLWKTFLEEQFLVSGNERNRIERLICFDERLAWDALLALNLPQIGPWTVSTSFLPTGTASDEQPQYLKPNMEVKAIHRDTRKERIAVIPGGEFHDPTRKATAWKKAFETLKLSELLDRGPIYKGLASRRPQRAWPVFTQRIIPALYEFMYPHYRKQGHHSEKRDELEVRPALFPKELLEHMLAVLRLENPDIFDSATTEQFKAVIQRHLDRSRQSTNSSK